MTIALTLDEKIRLVAALREKHRRIEARRLVTERDQIMANCQTLIGFIREFWYVPEPAKPFVSGWAIETMAHHLEAVTSGDIKRLLMTVPPGMMKSLMLAFWTAWEWGPKGMAHIQVLATSYSQDNVLRDNMKLRDIVLSEKFQTLWPLAIRADANAKSKFINTASGLSWARPFGSMTGGRADRVKIDDPHSVKAGESDVQRKASVLLFREQITDRLNDMAHSAIIIIMQRIHMDDVAAAAIAMGSYVHLNLPMRYEPKSRCVTPWGGDQRSEQDELLFPERFADREMRQLESEKGAYAWSAQYQQSPAPRGGGIFRDNWWRFYTTLPPVRRIVQSWDTAFKAKQENDPSSCTVWAECEGGYYLIHRHNDRMEYPLLKQFVISLGMKEWSGMRAGVVLVEDKASGQSLIQDLRNTNLPIVPIKVDTDKVTRAYAVTGIIESGRVFLPEGAPWLADYLSQMGSFPTAAHDDDVDSTTQALTYMAVGGAPGVGFLDFYRSEMEDF